MATDKANFDTIFCAAIEMPSPDARSAYIAEACGTDAELRGRVEKLVAAHFRAGSFLETPSPDSPVTVDQPIREETGTMVGPYKLLEPIGEGGMGTVWMAQQSEPIKRLVAIKLIKPGMDSKQVLARFDAERQALALMDHPNIAKVFDAGATSETEPRTSVSGPPQPLTDVRGSVRPFFVMELVKGVPITKYCDEHHLTPRQRLELFIPVCQAIQHAHQKGIIHRDIKPSNVLVAMYDDRPVPKVIDFGVAKATGQQLTEETLHTGFGAVVGTIEYMSPEQASFNQLDVDTRSDIYSLGVLLYELLAGSPPFTKKDLEKAGMMEMLRVIREQEPSKPSTKLSSSDALPTLSANRGIEPARLTKLVRGELDWIVMKALEKDRSRRYETANGFAMDVQRYLADEAVQACPPSAGYRLRKFARRNKRALAAAGVLGLALVVAVGAVAGSLGWASRDRESRRAAAEQQAGEALARARVWVSQDNLALARQELAAAKGLIGNDRAALRSLADEVETLEVELGTLERFLGLVDQAHEAEISLAVAHAVKAETTKGAMSIPQLVRSSDRDPAKAVPFLIEALSCYQVLERTDWSSALERGLLESRQVAKIQRTLYEELIWLADDVLRRGQGHRFGRKLSPAEAAREGLAYLVKAEGVFRPTSAFYDARARCQKALGNEEAARADAELARHTAPAIALDHFLLGVAAYDARNKAEAVKQFEAALRVEPTHYWSLMLLGACLSNLGEKEQDFAAAVVAFTGCIMRRPGHAAGYLNRGIAFARLNRFDDALADYSKAIELKPDDWVAWFNRGNSHRVLRRYDEALADYSKAIQINSSRAPAWNNRGLAYTERGDVDKAFADFAMAMELAPKDPSPLNNRGMIYCDHLKQYDKAIADFSKAIHLDRNAAVPWYNRGNAHKYSGQHDKAVADYSRAIELRPDYAKAHNDFAWMLATAIEPKHLDPSRAVELAKKAVGMEPTNGGWWNTLGVAQYRAEAWEATIEALSRSIDLRKGGDGFDWIFLAMAHWRLGHKEQARQWFDKAVHWIEKNAPKDKKLGRFRAEAEELLGVKAKKD